ncbi:DUF4363 family protein [Ethanoligenens harbinense]|uniref:DUF4363 domain-containing protein n=1 Tax=Ethanoligenens harbinense (strain DSM 18485 / JCM 12961 / CGMCC 1.5033 / YUAN-3) TaxID=663278 RepID=E6U7Q0_ETHHY|nr:DUF4363 family protein [Ethanoligenens harbinense]ADU28173.1 hypothetical protein Ethha_2680 [Ethanoligenens harbinense YUAN-3]AVQ97177.1 DUF4363 domain-containing protein [Ethanoligenens harbinense YUAN-3]AYF39840.1 DUF4363 domain-containing protein [Ethanoligenens harbinense]AYF42672.1 DUF4363 domain-containing protein [Ethanoligenens harbinense]QCN93421.1 DUF4363 family protein [Ethanoligenens harbinense]
MNKLKVVAIILILVIAVIAAGQYYLAVSTHSMVNAVETAQAAYHRNGDSPDTQKKMRQFFSLWQKNSRILPMMIDHREIDIVNTSVAKLPAYLENNETSEFDAECDILKMQLAHLWYVEKINWENIL